MGERFRVSVNGLVVASVDSPTFIRGEVEIMRYAHQYVEEGRVTVQRMIGGKWRLFSTIETAET